MSESDEETVDQKSHIRCTACDKLLAKDLHNDCLEIKCPRCDAFNTVHVNGHTTIVE